MSIPKRFCKDLSYYNFVSFEDIDLIFGFTINSYTPQTITSHILHHLHLIAFMLISFPQCGQDLVLGLIFIVFPNKFIILSGPPEPEKKNTEGRPVILIILITAANKTLPGKHNG